MYVKYVHVHCPCMSLHFGYEAHRHLRSVCKVHQPATYNRHRRYPRRYKTRRTRRTNACGKTLHGWNAVWKRCYHGFGLEPLQALLITTLGLRRIKRHCLKSYYEFRSTNFIAARSERSLIAGLCSTHQSCIKFESTVT